MEAERASEDREISEGLPVDDVLCEPEHTYTHPDDYRTTLGIGLRKRYTWARQNMELVQRKLREHQGKTVVNVRSKRARVFKDGDRVMVHTEARSGDDLTAKLKLPWRGPYVVLAKVGEYTYQLESTPACHHGNALHDKPTVHADRMKPYLGSVELAGVREPVPWATIEPLLGPLWVGGHDDECARCAQGGLLVICGWCNETYHKECHTSLTNHEERGREYWCCPRCY